jgi:hypothetical protein
MPESVVQRIHQRVLLIARAGMHDHAGRLVDHEQIVVFEKDRERNHLRRGVDLLHGWNLQLHDVASAHDLPRARLRRVQPNEAALDQRLESRTRKIGQLQREEAVQPQPRAFAADLQLDHGRSPLLRSSFRVKPRMLRSRRWSTPPLKRRSSNALRAAPPST